MKTLLIYLFGWFLFSACYYIYNVYFNNDNSDSKKLIMYNAFKFGLCSWVGIIFMISASITYCIISIDNYITNKLK